MVKSEGIKKGNHTKDRTYFHNNRDPFSYLVLAGISKLCA